MTTHDDSDAIRADIERTRTELSDNVNTLTETANPKNVAGRQVEKVKGAARNVRDHVMGAPDDPYDSGRLGDAGDAVTDKAAALKGRASNAADTVADAPHQIRRKARGNPLAAGLIAFGIGYLISSAIPSTEREQQAAQRLREKAEPLKEALSDTAQELGDRLREPARDAAESVKAAAGDAVSTVKNEGEAAKDEVKDQVQSSSEAVRGSTTT
jgi:hypothetical protein